MSSGYSTTPNFSASLSLYRVAIILAKGVKDMKLLRTVVALVLVMGLLVGMVPMALAAPGSGSAHASLAFHHDKSRAPWVRNEIVLTRGTVAGVAGKNITVESAGEEVEITVNDKTRYNVSTPRWEASLEDIEEGMKIVALTLREDGNHIARQIRVLPGRFLPVFRLQRGYADLEQYPGGSIYRH